jgi:hypothetical protein
LGLGDQNCLEKRVRRVGGTRACEVDGWIWIWNFPATCDSLIFLQAWHFVILEKPTRVFDRLTCLLLLHTTKDGRAGFTTVIFIAASVSL